MSASENWSKNCYHFLPLLLLRLWQSSWLQFGPAQKPQGASESHGCATQPKIHRGNFWIHGWVFLNRGSSLKGWWIPKIKENNKGEQIHPLHGGEEPVFGEFIKLQDEAVVSLWCSHEFWPIGAFTARQEKHQSWALSLQCQLSGLSEHYSLSSLNEQTAHLQTGSFLGYHKCCSSNPTASTHLAAGLFNKSLIPPSNEL